MSPIRIIVLALALAPALAVAANPLLRGDTLEQLTEISANDGIPSGWCGRAMLSLLNKAGLSKGLKPGNGQDWEKILSAAGWRPLRVASPVRAPFGSVLVYSSDRMLGKAPRGTPGGYFGHVEMVSRCDGGRRMYVADLPRVAPGGSVPDNFTGRAWVPPGTMMAAPAPIDTQISIIMEQRLKMAQDYFQDRRTMQAAVEPEVQSVRIR